MTELQVCVEFTNKSFCCCFSSAYGQNEEVRLIKTLLEKYPKDGGRPVGNSTDALEVKLKLSLLHIEDLDQFTKVFRIVGWLQQVILPFILSEH